MGLITVNDSFTYPPSLGRNKKDQLYYLKGEKEPYTGPYEILDNHGQLLFKGHFKDGKDHGVYEEFENGEEYSDWLLNTCHIFIAPGFIFGSEGNKYIRMSICVNESILNEVKNRILHV